jgi:hypothetical protein
MGRTLVWRWVSQAAALGLSAALLGCGSRSAPGPAGDDSTGGQVGQHRPQGFYMTREQGLQADINHANSLPPQALAALRSLGFQQPSAAHLPRHRTSTDLPWGGSGDQQYMNPGDAGWIVKSGDVDTVSPALALSPLGGAFPDNFSYVIYRIDDVNPAPKTLKLTCDGFTGNLGVVAYDWAAGSLGSWKPVFYGVPDVNNQAVAALDKLQSAQWTNPGGDLAFAVFCLSPSAGSVSQWELSDVTSNVPPFARLVANAGSGHAPLNTVLDASLSHDEGSIAKYRFDPLGDGNWVDNGANPMYGYTYVDPGAYKAQLEVTDDGGLSTIQSTWVLVSAAGYNEVEPNNGRASANMLPDIPFGPFYGNIGAKAGGYDGGIDDYLTFDADAGDEVRFLVNYSSDDAQEVSVSLEDSSGQTLREGIEENPLQIVYEFDGSEIAPFYVHIHCAAGNTDYMLTSDDIVYEELEDNDSAGGAQRLHNLTDQHSMSGFDGNVGAGGPNDGDSDDWYYFATGALDYHLQYNVTYDPAADIGVTLTDFDGDVLATSSGGGGNELINYDFQPGDTAPYFIEVVAADGASDYSQSGTLSLINPGFDEQEDNDYAVAANDLGEFPFSGFTGNIGSGGNYDGDSEDWFSFLAHPGDKLKFTITPGVSSPPLQVQIFDSNFRPVGGADVDQQSGIVVAHGQIRSNDAAPFYLVLTNFGQALDYSIDRFVEGFDESENNDDFAGADTLPDGNFQFFSGSLGSGGSNQDGDSLDVFTFAADIGDSPTFTVFYDDATGELDGILHDSTHSVIGYATSNDNGTLTIAATDPIQAGDVAPFYLELSATSQYADYWISRGDLGF